ncbi:hypothetical protein BD779DRAFT_1477638 [Infundibulicybe gibba]|nr:hypothetical protein BD779DRAFT_1477638 [Infundibulicybe gibba]
MESGTYAIRGVFTGTSVGPSPSSLENLGPINVVSCPPGGQASANPRLMPQWTIKKPSKGNHLIRANGGPTSVIDEHAVAFSHRSEKFRGRGGPPNWRAVVRAVCTCLHRVVWVWSALWPGRFRLTTSASTVIHESQMPGHDTYRGEWRRTERRKWAATCAERLGRACGGATALVIPCGHIADRCVRSGCGFGTEVPNGVMVAGDEVKNWTHCHNTHFYYHLPIPPPPSSRSPPLYQIHARPLQHAVRRFNERANTGFNSRTCPAMIEKPKAGVAAWARPCATHSSVQRPRPLQITPPTRVVLAQMKVPLYLAKDIRASPPTRRLCTAMCLGDTSPGKDGWDWVARHRKADGGKVGVGRGVFAETYVSPSPPNPKARQCRFLPARKPGSGAHREHRDTTGLYWTIEKLPNGHYLIRTSRGLVGVIDERVVAFSDKNEQFGGEWMIEEAHQIGGVHGPNRTYT